MKFLKFVCVSELIILLLEVARFQDWNSERSTEGHFSDNNRINLGKIRFAIISLSEKFQRGAESGSDRFKGIRKSFKSYSFNCNIGSSKEVLDLQGPFLQSFVLLHYTFSFIWKRGFSLRFIGNSREVSAIILYNRCSSSSSPPTGGDFNCYTSNESLGVVEYEELVDIYCFLPYLPRVFRIYPLYKEITRTSGILNETAWAGAVFNLFLYVLVSHVFGAFWYLFSIEMEYTYWKNACWNNTECSPQSFYCDGDFSFSMLLYQSCPIQTPNTTHSNFGIFLDALQSGVVESEDFQEKFFYCFWWGLQNLSSLGQNLETSTYVLETCFAVFISISGLVLFSFLIGNMLTYLQSTTTRLEEMRLKRRDAEQWMSHRLLPESLRERIRQYEQYKWQETRGVNEENLLCNILKDLRRDITRHLCLALLMRASALTFWSLFDLCSHYQSLILVFSLISLNGSFTEPVFEKMDEQLLDAMCDRLKPVLFTEESYIVREGEPVDEMLFIMRGKLLTMITNGGKTGFFNSEYLGAGDFCGEEFLTWALDPYSSLNLPISTRTSEHLQKLKLSL
ncbi:cyclic nucleotide-gated ion channel 1-like [Hibiscus syriacus]|uniref:cyclic nucleotide-gated ion channel 1-like n=1 Tax=Hibiscus syriacus TaxID=106335 RepID=UPI001923B586|nr:cyclic nucleotide-gated ion channel 1-like [Hibiscus syriacus]